jgi:AcrR family transcriptional regulator
MARIRTAPRKAPTQQRSRATVDAIVDATARVLVRDGYDALSTNRVAQEAGVSVGSLYQYFPGKEALVAAVMEQYASRMQENIAARMTNAPPAATAEEVATELIRAMLVAQQAEPRLHRVLVEQVPRLKGGLDVVRRVSQQSATLVRSFLETQRKHLREVDLDVATFMLVTAVESVAHLQVLDRPTKLTPEALVEELSQLVLGYLGVRRR